MRANRANQNSNDFRDETQAELDLLDGATAGTILNDKVVVYGSSGEVNGTTLQIAGTSIDATAAQIDIAAVPADGVEDVTATNVITAAESGKTFFLNSTTEFVSTLPAPAAGLNYTFIVKAAPSGADYTVVTNGGADIMIGMVTCATADDLGQYDANADVITFADGASIVGDWVRVISDGTSWYFSGASHVAEGITSGTT